MIPLPALPTDNLYKFLFVFGIVLIASSQYFLYQTLESRTANVIAYSHSISKSRRVVDSLGIVLRKMDSQLTDFERRTKSKEELVRFQFKLDSFALANNTANYKNKDFQTEMELMHTSYMSSITLAFLIMFTGVTIAFIGAVRWLFRVQIPLDKLLRLQVEQLQTESVNKSSIAGRAHFEPQTLPRRRR